MGQSSRFFASFKRQREHYATGIFGELNTVEAAYHADHRWFLEKKWALTDAFNWLYGGISHPADLVRSYMPDIVEVAGCRLPQAANGKKWGLKHPDTFHFALKAAQRQYRPRVSGSYTTPIVPEHAATAASACILRCAQRALRQADYKEPPLRLESAGDQTVIETFEDQEDYYFRFGGRTHHAGEYQNYIEYFARCIESNQKASPDVDEGLVTMALMQAMQDAYTSEKPVKIADVLTRYGLGDLAS